MLKKITKKVLYKTQSGILNKINELENEIRSHQNLLEGKMDDLTKQVNSFGVFQLSNNELIKKIFSGAKMYLDPRDVAVVPHLILDGRWEWDVTQAWLKTVKAGDTVLDIGANFGYFGLLAVQQTNKNSKTILFEANPNLIPYLEKTFNVNSFSECTKIENLAVADVSGKVRLNILKDYIGSSSLHSAGEIKEFTESREEVKVASSVEVSSISIDDYCKKNAIRDINLIKMDIEGFEDKAYYGMRKTIHSSNDVTLFVEFTKKAYDNPKKFYNDMLSDFGHVYLIYGDGRLVKQKDTAYETVINSPIEWTMPVFSKRPNLS